MVGKKKGVNLEKIEEKYTENLFLIFLYKNNHNNDDIMCSNSYSKVYNRQN